MLPNIPIVLSVGTYNAGDVVGGILELPGNSRSGSSINSITLVDQEGVSPSLSILIFSEEPSGGDYVDSSPFSWGGTDTEKLTNLITVQSLNWKTVDGYSVVSLNELEAQTANGAFLLILADSSYAVTSTSSLKLRVGMGAS